MALRDDKPGICRFRDAAPDRFRSSEYYRQYCERTHLGDEMDYLIGVNGSTLALVVGRFEGRFSRAETRRLHAIEDIVHSAMQRMWLGHDRTDAGSGDRTIVHARLTECFR